MATVIESDIVWIGNVPYSRNHPKVLALQRAKAPQQGVPDPAPSSLIKGIRVANRIRQSSKPLMNKTEEAFMRHLWSFNGVKSVHPQAIKFKLCNGVNYSPDFVVVHDTGKVSCYEVKGFMRDDAAVKIKVAAREYPGFEWILAWKDDGCWRTQLVLP